MKHAARERCEQAVRRSLHAALFVLDAGAPHLAVIYIAKALLDVQPLADHARVIKSLQESVAG